MAITEPHAAATAALDASARGDYPAAARLLLDAERLSAPGVVDRLVYRVDAAWCYVKAGDPQRAYDLFGDIDVTAHATAASDVVFHWLSIKAAVETELGYWHAAEQNLDAAMLLADEQGAAFCFEVRARVAARRGQYNRAVGLLKHDAIPSYTTTPISTDFTATEKAGKIADCTLAIARILLEIASDQQSISAAETYFEDAGDRYAQLPGRHADLARTQLGQVRCAVRRATGGATVRARWRSEARTRLTGVTTTDNDDLLTADIDLLRGHLWLLDALDPATTDPTRCLDNAAAAFEQAADEYRTHPRQSAGCTVSRGNVEAARGDLPAARATYEAARTAFHDLGALDWEARTALALANLAAGEGRFDDALATVLPAVLYLDARRFSLPTAATRTSYRTVIEDGLAIAFQAATQLPDRVAATVIAQLIETVINSGVHAPTRSDTTTDQNLPTVSSESLDDDAPDLPTQPHRAPADYHASITNFFDTTLVLPLLPPPLLRMPGPQGAIALHDHIQAADEQYETVARTPGVLPVV